LNAISEFLYRGASIETATKALILLHGRGGTAQDVLQLAGRLCDSDFYVVAPQATNNVWYPHKFMEAEELNEPYLTASVTAIKELIDQIAKYIPKNRLYIGGFSQGACLSLEVSSRFATKYGGIFAFTGGLIGPTINETRYQGDFAGTRVFISNGDHDPHIPQERSEKSAELMEKLGADVTVKIYKGRPHIILADEIQYVKREVL
jgi:phospholipase/carboxylesterase